MIAPILNTYVRQLKDRIYGLETNSEKTTRYARREPIVAHLDFCDWGGAWERTWPLSQTQIWSGSDHIFQGWVQCLQLLMEGGLKLLYLKPWSVWPLAIIVWYWPTASSSWDVPQSHVVRDISPGCGGKMERITNADWSIRVVVLQRHPSAASTYKCWLRFPYLGLWDRGHGRPRRI